MLSAGISLVDALSTLESQFNKGALHAILADVRGLVERGTRLTRAMAAYPTVFSSLYLRLLQTGEVTGRMAETSERLATYMEDNAELRRKIRMAMMYPAVVGAIAVIVFTVMLVWIVPGIESIYAGLGHKLPKPTQVIMAASRLARHYGLFILPGVFAVVGLLSKFVQKTDIGARFLDAFLMRVPVVGVLRQKIAIGRFAESLGALVQGGIPLLSALDIAAQTTGSRLLTDAILDARNDVARGQPLSASLARNRYMPPLLLKMLAVGEKTGRTDEMLAKVSAFYRSEVNAVLAGITSIIEPVLILFLGITIGGMVVGMFLPIFKLHEVVSF
jgi:type IV pilus assembly protein PilC